jgi:hypothetical protein
MRSCLAICVALIISTPAFAQGDEVDRKTLKRILEEIELVPSLYAKGETAITVKTAPKFSSLKLVGYPIGKINMPDAERPKWLKDKAAYAKDYPLRAAVFEAEAASAAAMKLEIAMTLQPDPKLGYLTAKEKAGFFQQQEGLGRAIFDLENALTQMKNAVIHRDAEKVRRWKVDFDFAMTRLQGNIVFLYEYNFTLGQIRADTLPQLRDGDTGWKIAARPKIHVTEQRAKDLAKARATLLQKFQDEHADTPWAYYASRDAKRELGMQWAARKK